MTQDTTPDFDWVGAQAQCTPRSMFERLRTKVREDVEKRNGLTQRQDRWKFEFYDEDEGEFEVLRHVPTRGLETTIKGVVTFVREGSRIQVRGEDVDVEFVAVVTLDVSGACRFVVGEAVYSDWELRRMALELLFFEEFGDEE